MTHLLSPSLLSHFWYIMRIKANLGIYNLISAHVSQADWMHFGCQRCDNKGVWVSVMQEPHNLCDGQKPGTNTAR